MKPMEPMTPMSAENGWWPRSLGTPSSSGSQNDSRYAYFADARRLVVDSGGSVRTFDTGAHRIRRFGQQQGGGSGLAFETDDGPLALDALKPA